MSIKDVLAAALQRNETTTIKSAQLEQTKAKLSQAQAGSLPQVSVIAGVTKEDSSSANTGSATRESTQKAARVNVSQPLLSLLKDYDLIEAAKESVAASEHSSASALLDLQVTVNKSFHTLIAAIRDIDNLVKLRDATKKRVAELTSRVRIGRSRPADLFSAQAQLAANDAQLEAAKATEALARNDLSESTGLTEDVKVVDTFDMPRDIGDIASYLEKIEALPSIKALKAQQHSSDLQIRAARSQHIPQLDLFGNYYLYREKPLDGIKWDAGLQLTIPLYQGGMVTAKVAEAVSAKTEVDAELAQKRRLIDLMIRQAYESVTTSMRQISFLKNSADLAEKSYKQIEDDYQLGLSTNLEVIQAFNSVAEARRQLDKQLVAAKSAYITLLLTAGSTL